MKQNSATEKADNNIDALPCDTWAPFGSSTPSITRSDTKDFWLKCVISNNFNPNATSNFWMVKIVSK